MCHRPKEAITQCFTVAFEKKASDFAVLLPDILNRLSVKHKDEEVLAVKYQCSEAFVFIAVSIINYPLTTSYNHRAAVLTLSAPFLANDDLNLEDARLSTF